MLENCANDLHVGGQAEHAGAREDREDGENTETDNADSDWDGIDKDNPDGKGFNDWDIYGADLDAHSCAGLSGSSNKSDDDEVAPEDSERFQHSNTPELPILINPALLAEKIDAHGTRSSTAALPPPMHLSYLPKKRS